MQVRAVRGFLRHQPGSVIELPDGVANVWIRRGYAVQHANQKTTTEEPEKNIKQATKPGKK
jgi:hypothetical protein